MSGADTPGGSGLLPQVGLCSTCRHAQRQPSARGSTFWRCLRADADPAWRRYPPLPVTRCAGHEPAPTSPRASGPPDATERG